MNVIKEIMKELNPPLKQMGFNIKGNNFYLEANKNYGIINFQKSRDSTKEVIKFTINFGVYSDILGQFEYDYTHLTKPSVEQCQWEARVGEFMPGSPDHWWVIHISDNLAPIALSVKNTIEEIVIPEINKRISDDGLIYSWINEKYAGTTEIGRFKYLTILLKAKGDKNVLNQVVETFMQQPKGKPNAILAMEHLKEIGYNK